MLTWFSNHLFAFNVSFGLCTKDGTRHLLAILSALPVVTFTPHLFVTWAVHVQDFLDKHTLVHCVHVILGIRERTGNFRHKLLTKKKSLEWRHHCHWVSPLTVASKTLSHMRGDFLERPILYERQELELICILLSSWPTSVFWPGMTFSQSHKTCHFVSTSDCLAMIFSLHP